ncbi:MFS transporter [Rhizomonospora bruguierae]|uniref:MFS transporter n=1 Tax=Rhizomonospora bruguierae TaxID=1581705 RepID=UPI001BCDE6C8|nr:MFS transporter [Micromonospora sp. NBRC 107566]
MAIAGTRPAVPPSVVSALALGTLLNPLNSSMIAVALISLDREFGVGVGSVTWLISGFYLAACVSQPLMGRLADQYGPRRIFLVGLVIVALAGVAAVTAPGFWWLVGCRVVQAVGTSAAFPAGLALIRRIAGTTPPAATLATLGITASGSAALGPVLGGVLVAFTGWRGVFAVNIPLALIGLVMALRWLPADGVRRPGSRHRPDESQADAVAGAGEVAVSGMGARGAAAEAVGSGGVGACTATTVAPIASGGDGQTGGGRTGAERDAGRGAGIRGLDLPGAAFFSVAVVGLLGFLLSVGARPQWWLLGVCVVAGAVLTWRELRVGEPFIDVRALARDRGLASVFGQQIAVQFVFYAIFFSLPLWLEGVRGLAAERAGLVMLPIAALGVLGTPVAARLVRRRGAGLPLVLGSIGLVAGSAALFVLGDHTPIVGVLAATLVLGLPNAFNNMGLQAALYQTAPPEGAGAAGGLFQTCRYVGAIFSTALLGLMFAGGVTTNGLHVTGAVALGVSGLLVLAAVDVNRRLARP